MTSSTESREVSCRNTDVTHRVLIDPCFSYLCTSYTLMFLYNLKLNSYWNKKYVLWNAGICPIASKVGHVTLATPPFGVIHYPLYTTSSNGSNRENTLAQNRNPRWQTAAILDFQKSDFWALGPFGLLIFHHRTKFGAKMLIDAKIMAQNLNPRWRPSAILDFQKSDFWALGPLGLPIFYHGVERWLI